MKWKNLVCIVAFAAMLLPAYVQAEEAVEEWVKRYDSGYYDWNPYLAVDGSGNVYVAGTSMIAGINYITIIKYDTYGNELWANRYDDGIFSFNMVADFKADSGGNVYVTGRSWNSIAGRWGLVVKKYDTSGRELWSTRYDDGYITEDINHIALDSSGNVYIATTSTEPFPDYYGYPSVFVTAKYDINGNMLWVKKTVLSGNNANMVTSLAVDSSGNTYLTGRYYGGGEAGYSSVTIKYDTNGNELWRKKFDRGGDEILSTSVVDSLGNVYGTGAMSTEGTGGYLTVKYDTNGNELWSKWYTPGGGGAIDIALDSSGNIYVTGFTGGGLDYTTIKYDNNGNELWVKKFGSSYGTSPHAITVDLSGNSYVTGTSEGDYVTIKYDTNGNEIWVKRYYGIGGTGYADVATAIALDSHNNVFVTGYSTNSYPVVNQNGMDFATIKYSQSLPTVSVQIDIKPSSFPNTIKLQDTGNIPVAIFSTSTFDARTIDVASLELSGASVRIVKGKGLQYSFEDANNDGLLDLVVHFGRGTLELIASDTSATVTGMTLDGKQIQGTDSVVVIE